MKFMTGKHEINKTVRRKEEFQENPDPDHHSGLFSLTEKQARYCYGMSKMTIVLEGSQALDKYDKLSVVEFIELLGRIAKVKYEGTEFENESFVKKLEYTLETALSHINMERVEQAVVEDDSSNISDQDY